MVIEKANGIMRDIMEFDEKVNHLTHCNSTVYLLIYTLSSPTDVEFWETTFHSRVRSDEKGLSFIIIT